MIELNDLIGRLSQIQTYLQDSHFNDAYEELDELISELQRPANIEREEEQ